MENTAKAFRPRVSTAVPDILAMPGRGGRAQERAQRGRRPSPDTYARHCAGAAARPCHYREERRAQADATGHAQAAPAASCGEQPIFIPSRVDTREVPRDTGTTVYDIP
jgi:hypothetical protein